MNTSHSSARPDPWQPPTPEELSGLLPGYEITALLGRGGMGAVYKGTQLSLDREVAIKLLPPDLGADPDFQARFRREAKSMAKLNHPNIVQIFDYGQTASGQHYFIMEYVDGSDLLHLVRSGTLDAEGALNAVSQVCEALQYAHELGFVHRDIKPANILINRKGVLKVGDFGLARLVEGHGDHAASINEEMGLTMTGMTMGTPHYAAPEQFDGLGHIDHRADLYSLGIMFYEMLTRDVPRGTPKAPSKKIPNLDVRIDGVVFKAMEPDPDERYQSAAALRTDIDRIRSTPPAPSPAAEPPRPTPQAQRPQARPSPPRSPGGPSKSAKPPPRKSSFPLTAVVGTLVVLGGIFGFLQWQGSQNAPEKPDPTLAKTPPSEPASKSPTTTPAPETAPNVPPVPTVPEKKPEEENPAKPAVAAESLPPMDKPPAVVRTESSASRDTPFINTLGMKFVPLPITGGLADGQQVLFSVWETRVKDFDAFVKEAGYNAVGGMKSIGKSPGPKQESQAASGWWAVRGHTWKDPGFTQTPLHPVVGVNWDDANAFCLWLTQKERLSGKISSNQVYRLPKDLEWSLAVGLKSEIGNTPAERKQQLSRNYPWGDQWPPPANAGNLAGSEVADDNWPDQFRPLPGYKDLFPRTSPVGSFPANQLGIYDLAGNVAEFCEDWFDASQTSHVRRGSSWDQFDAPEIRLNMYSSHRYGTGDYRRDTIGFRVVLAGVSAPPTPVPATAGATPSEAGFTKIFNGRDLTGWAGDKRFWSVRDGTITAESPPNGSIPVNTCLIWQGGNVTDFELRLSYKITSGNSGVQYRSKVLDPAAWVVGGYQYEIATGKFEIKNGGLYEERGSRKALASPGGDYLANPGEKIEWTQDGARKVTGNLGSLPPYHSGDWNELIIIAQGNRLMHRLNGSVTIDMIDDDATAKAISGVLALQLHSGAPQKVQFKDIRIKQAKSSGAGVSSLALKAPDKAQSLFDGSTLDGWTVRGDPASFKIEDGCIKATGAKGNLIFVDKGVAPAWKDFDLTMKVKLKPNTISDSGLYIHCPANASSSSKIALEIQISNDPDPLAERSTGSVFDVAPIPMQIVRNDRWFDLRIIVSGMTVTVFINGKKVNEWTQPAGWTPPENVPSARLGSGSIGLQSYTGETLFKDVRITLP